MAKGRSLDKLPPLGRNIRARRLSLWWSQEDLSERCGVPRSAIARIELGGTRRPSYEDIKKIAKALGCTAEELTELQPSSPSSLVGASGKSCLPQYDKDLVERIVIGVTERISNQRPLPLVREDDMRLKYLASDTGAEAEVIALELTQSDFPLLRLFKGDRVIVKSDPPQDGDFVLATQEESKGLILGYYHHDEKGSPYIESPDPRQPRTSIEGWKLWRVTQAIHRY